MLNQSYNQIIENLRNSGLDISEYERFEKIEKITNFTDDEGHMCLGWSPSLLFDASCNGVDIFRHNITRDYMATVRMYGVDKTIGEVKKAYHDKFCSHDSPILFNSRNAEITSVTKNKEEIETYEGNKKVRKEVDLFRINIMYHADEGIKIMGLYKFLNEEIPGTVKLDKNLLKLINEYL